MEAPHRYRHLLAALVPVLMLSGLSSEQGIMKERELSADRELWNILGDKAHLLDFDSEEDSSFDEDMRKEDDGNEDLLSLADRSLDDGSRDNRKPKVVVCQVFKVRRELGDAVTKYKPAVLENYVCKQKTELSDSPLDDILMHYSNGNLPVEFCFLHTSHAHHHIYKNCHTKTTQVSLFSRRFNSTEWSHESRKVAVGCGCEIGLKYYD